MKLWIVLLAVICTSWLSIVEKRPRITTIQNENKPIGIFREVRFTTQGANRRSYQIFMNELYDALTERADNGGVIPVLPSPLPEPDDHRQYVLVELSNEYQYSVKLALNVSDVYILGYHPGDSDTSYFFDGVAEDVRNALFPDSTVRRDLPYTGMYGSLENFAGVNDRRDIPLGIGELHQHINYMNIITQPDSSTLAKALLVCIQMVSEAVRLRNLQHKILEVADPDADGNYGVYYPDLLMTQYEGAWGKISEAVQSTTNGIFTRPVSLKKSDREFFDLKSVKEVIFIVGIISKECNERGNVQIFPTSTSASESPSLLPIPMRSTSLESNDDTCEIALAPTSYITGRNGLCVDVYQESYRNGNKIILSKCGQNKASQLWELRMYDNTIRSGGKCLTTSYVMIHDCETAISDATKWEIQSDGAIRNPKSELVLTASEDSWGVINLVVDKNIYASKQTWYASNITKPPVTTIVGYQGLCLLAFQSSVWLEFCVSYNIEQQWAIYPDGTIRPPKNQDGCLKYANAEEDVVRVGTCDGGAEERWRFQSDGTILHVMTRKVMDVKDTTAILPEITVNNYNRRNTQIWFQV
ncbi:abrin-b-like [Gossypium arboreum]|nr:abrin-b-like [Gossypium arboreum]